MRSEVLAECFMEELGFMNIEVAKKHESGSRNFSQLI